MQAFLHSQQRLPLLSLPLPSSGWLLFTAAISTPGSEHLDKTTVMFSTGTSLSLYWLCQESLKVVLKSANNPDLLNLKTIHAAEGKVNLNPFFLTKTLVSYKQTFWSRSWRHILIVNGITGCTLKFRETTQKAMIDKTMNKNFSCVIQKMKLKLNF